MGSDTNSPCKANGFINSYQPCRIRSMLVLVKYSWHQQKPRKVRDLNWRLLSRSFNSLQLETLGQEKCNGLFPSVHGAAAISSSGDRKGGITAKDIERVATAHDSTWTDR